VVVQVPHVHRRRRRVRVQLPDAVHGRRGRRVTGLPQATREDGQPHLRVGPLVLVVRQRRLEDGRGGKHVVRQPAARGRRLDHAGHALLRVARPVLRRGSLRQASEEGVAANAGHAARRRRSVGVQRAQGARPRAGDAVRPLAEHDEPAGGPHPRVVALQLVDVRDQVGRVHAVGGEPHEAHWHRRAEVGALQQLPHARTDALVGGVLGQVHAVGAVGEQEAHHADVVPAAPHGAVTQHVHAVGVSGVGVGPSREKGAQDGHAACEHVPRRSARRVAHRHMERRAAVSAPRVDGEAVRRHGVHDVRRRGGEQRVAERRTRLSGKLSVKRPLLRRQRPLLTPCWAENATSVRCAADAAVGTHLCRTSSWTIAASRTATNATSVGDWGSSPARWSAAVGPWTAFVMNSRRPRRPAAAVRWATAKMADRRAHVPRAQGEGGGTHP